jgi:hypothetical protein
MALAEFASAVEKRPAKELRRPATSDPSQPRRKNVVRTSPHLARRRRSRLQSRAKSQLSLGSIILLTQTRRTRATRRLPSSGVDLRHPLRFNAADEVSCRAGAIKCSRCRASFAPIRPEFSGREVGSPAEPATHRSTKRNKELAGTSDREFLTSSKSACGIYAFYSKTADS